MLPVYSGGKYLGLFEQTHKVQLADFISPRSDNSLGRKDYIAPSILYCEDRP